MLQRTANEKGYNIDINQLIQKIGIGAIQQAHAAKTIYNTTRAMVITNNYFTNDAIKNAQMLNIELWDRNQLIQTLHEQLK
jgi:HJR/Mrr/RecB family endonuclease